MATIQSPATADESVRHPSSDARGIKNNPVPTTMTPMTRATRSPAGCETFGCDRAGDKGHGAQIHDAGKRGGSP